MWIGGTVLGELEVEVDERPVGTRRHEVAHEGQWLRFGALHLSAGRHVVRVSYMRGGAPLQVVELDPRRYRRPCDGRTYDWIEAY